MAYNIIKVNLASTVKKILFFAAVLVCLIIINNLARSIYDLWHKQDLVVSANKDLEEEKIENQRLKSLLKKIKNPEFIEEEARNKLFLVKPGESGVIVPPNLASAKQEKPTVTLPNYRKWLSLFGF